VLGGHIRDEPIDRSKVEHDWELTAVDKALMHWFMKELCKRCTSDPKEDKEQRVAPEPVSGRLRWCLHVLPQDLTVWLLDLGFLGSVVYRSSTFGFWARAKSIKSKMGLKV
jgi:hypothetical protein